MIRRNWKDLKSSNTGNEDSSTSSTGNSQGLHPNFKGEQQSGDLDQAAAMLPESRLNDLLQQRQKLESRIAGLSVPSDSNNSNIDLRYPVLSFAERQQQEREWEQRRDSVDNNVPPPIVSSSGGSAENGLGPTPLETRLHAEPTQRSSIDNQPFSSFHPMTMTRRRLQQSILTRRGSDSRIENGLTKLRQLGRDAADQAQDMSNQMRDLDRQLAENDVSQADRGDIRDLMKADQIDKVASGLEQANKALDAPKTLVNGIERKWKGKEDLISGAMDRIGPYVEARDRRLSSDTGGSGDLFERMQRNRERALERRRQQRLTDHQDEQRRKRAKKNRQEKSKEQQREKV